MSVLQVFCNVLRVMNTYTVITDSLFSTLFCSLRTWKYKIKPRYSELYCEVLLVKITSLLVLSFSVLIFLTYGLLLLFCVTKEDQQWAYILDVNNVHETNEAIIFTIVFMYIRPK